MGERAYTPEQMIRKLRAAELMLGQGATAPQASDHIGVSEQTCYRWRRESGDKQSRILSGHSTRFVQLARPWTSGQARLLVLLVLAVAGLGQRIDEREVDDLSNPAQQLILRNEAIWGKLVVELGGELQKAPDGYPCISERQPACEWQRWHR